MEIRLGSDEFYPVLHTYEGRGLYPPTDITGGGAWYELTDVPDALAERFIAAERQFWAMQRELRSYLAAVHRDDTAYLRDAATIKRRLERGRRRPFRRARPTDRE